MNLSTGLQAWEWQSDKTYTTLSSTNPTMDAALQVLGLTKADWELLRKHFEKVTEKHNLSSARGSSAEGRRNYNNATEQLRGNPRFGYFLTWAERGGESPENVNKALTYLLRTVRHAKVKREQSAEAEQGITPTANDSSRRQKRTLQNRDDSIPLDNRHDQNASPRPGRNIAQPGSRFCLNNRQAEMPPGPEQMFHQAHPSPDHMAQDQTPSHYGYEPYPYSLPMAGPPPPAPYFHSSHFGYSGVPQQQGYRTASPYYPIMSGNMMHGYI